MKKLLPLVLSLSLSAGALAATGPIRVLYLGKEGTAASRRCAVLMQELGRDAIWFDYLANPDLVTPEWVEKFDAVFLDGPREDFKALAKVAPQRLIVAENAGDEKAWREAANVKAVQERLVAAVGQERRAEWEKFLAQREPEKREPNKNVANYERRPEPITFQYPYSPKGSMERTQVPIDMRLELFAAEPDIKKPIALTWDERGRLWVVETSDYPHVVNANGEGNDTIKICEDTNGDGKADKFTVFADKLNLPTGIVLTRGGAVVSQAPRFLFLKDTDGDDKADVREVIMEGWGIRDTHAQTSSLHYGFDNWLYGCVGYSNFKGTVGGKELAFGQGTYRFKSDGSALEFLHQFSNNSWGHGTNAYGDQFGGTANNAPIFYGGIPASLVPRGLKIMTAKRINVEDKAHAITPNYRQVDVMGGYTAAAGSAFLYSANMPERLQGNAMVNEPTMKLTALLDVKPEGAGYVAKDNFNLVASTDEWMSPVFSEVGPDGAVWVADWQNFIIQHNPTPSVRSAGYDAKTGVGGAHENPLRDHERGRIYRVVWEKATSPKIASLKDATNEQLVQALASDNQFWRLTAQRLLVEGGKKDAAALLKQQVVANNGSIGAVHALWALHGMGLLDEETHRAALMAKDPGLRRNAIRALAGDAKGLALLTASKVISDPDQHTRLAALVKLAEIPASPEAQALVAEATKDAATEKDQWLKEGIRLVSKVHNVADGEAQEKLLTGDPKRGEQLFFTHPTGACALCHMIGGKGSAVGPALDGIASRATPAYIQDSLLEPNKVLAKGYEALGVSPMPPMGVILKPQELEDIKAYLQTLK